MAVIKTFAEILYPNREGLETDIFEVSDRKLQSSDIPPNAHGYRFFDRAETIVDDELLFGDRKNQSGTTYLGKVASLDQLSREASHLERFVKWDEDHHQMLAQRSVAYFEMPWHKEKREAKAAKLAAYKEAISGMEEAGSKHCVLTRGGELKLLKPHDTVLVLDSNGNQAQVKFGNTTSLPPHNKRGMNP